VHAAREDADQDDVTCALVALDDLMRDASERALDVTRLQDRRGLLEAQPARLPPDDARGEGSAKKKARSNEPRAVV
jgi:hypothetical protein